MKATKQIWTPTSMGKKGGQTAAKNMTKKQRIERATKASMKAKEIREVDKYRTSISNT